MRLMNTVIQTNKRLELALGTLERENLASDEFDRKWALEFEKITKDYIEEQMSAGPLSKLDKNILRNFFKKLRWSEISQIHLKMWKKLRPIARAKGVTLMASLVVANILNYVVPYTLILLGQPYLGAVIFAAPVNPPTIFIYQVISRVKMEIELRRELGSFKEVREYRALNKQVREELALYKTTDFLVGRPLEDGSQFRLAKSSLLDTVSRIFGLRKNDMTIKGIQGFLKDEDRLSTLYERLLKDADLSEPVKAAMLIQEISTRDPELFSKFKLRFSRYLVSSQRAPLEMEVLEMWVAKTLKSKSAEDIYQNLLEAPEEIHPYHLLTTWEQILLPELASGEQLSYKQMRALTTRFTSFRLKKDLFLEELDATSVKTDFLRYFRSNLDVKRGSCFHTPAEVIGHLLKAQ